MMRRQLHISSLLLMIGLGALVGNGARGEDPMLPTMRTTASVFLVGQNHDFFVETELRLPVLRTDTVSAYYWYRETTPFLNLPDNTQAEVLYTRYEFRTDFKISDQLRLITVGGYDVSRNIDRTGKAGGYVLGAGLGSPLGNGTELYSWQVVAGTYIGRTDLDSNWWTDFGATWRVYRFHPHLYVDSWVHPSLVLAADVESSNVGGQFRPLYKVGPQLELESANGNRVNFFLRWYQTDNDPMYTSHEAGLLFGIDVISSRDNEYILDGRTKRQSGWLPMIWGEYDIGTSSHQQMNTFTMNVELVDMPVFGTRITPVIWYESNQIYKNSGGYNYITYSVSVGQQAPIGCASVLSHGDPLVAGIDFVHRSDHSIDPDSSRVPSDGLLEHRSINILPRVRLQTLGWDLPYRDPHIYERKTQWLNVVDWRLTAGNDSNSNRKRQQLDAQAGLNWDVATVQGYVLYSRGEISLNNETPDWVLECGVRRPSLKVFTRYESYGLYHSVGSGDIAIIGLGVNL